MRTPKRPTNENHVTGTRHADINGPSNNAQHVNKDFEQ